MTLLIDNFTINGSPDEINEFLKLYNDGNLRNYTNSSYVDVMDYIKHGDPNISNQNIWNNRNKK